jgi:formylglycine-generating enzyme
LTLRVSSRGLASFAVIAICAGAVIWLFSRGGDPPGPTCGGTFFPMGGRCCPTGMPAEKGHCAESTVCSLPLILTANGCDAPAQRVHVAATSLEYGSSDWEAEGKVPMRTLRTAAFDIDAFEVTVGQAFCATCPLPRPADYSRGDASRAAFGLSLSDARALCAHRGGRLPTSDEWIVAAAGPKGTRYPWGGTGAVCRRAAWGLAKGPCARDVGAPDTVGSHPDGTSAQGLFDAAGNVAEWVQTATGGAELRGGSFASEFAVEIRTWQHLDLPENSHDPRAGVRCAYSSP